MTSAILWTGRWRKKILGFLFQIRLRGVLGGCRNLLRTPARESGTGKEPRIRTVRQLAAAAGDGWLGSVGSPGQLETSLNSGYTVGPCNSYLEGPTPIFLGWLLAHRALGIRLVRRRSRRKLRLRSLLLTTAGARFPTLAAYVELRFRPARDLPTLAATPQSLSDRARDFRRSPHGGFVSDPAWRNLRLRRLLAVGGFKRSSQRWVGLTVVRGRPRLGFSSRGFCGAGR